MASAARDDAGGSVIGFAIVFVSFVFRGFIPAPTWVWLVVLAVGVLLAVKDGISGLDVITLVLAGVIVVGSLTSVANTATTDAPDLTLKEPIPCPGRVRLQAGRFGPTIPLAVSVRSDCRERRPTQRSPRSWTTT